MLARFSTHLGLPMQRTNPSALHALSLLPLEIIKVITLNFTPSQLHKFLFQTTSRLRHCSRDWVKNKQYAHDKIALLDTQQSYPLIASLIDINDHGFSVGDYTVFVEKVDAEIYSQKLQYVESPYDKLAYGRLSVSCRFHMSKPATLALPMYREEVDLRTIFNDDSRQGWMGSMSGKGKPRHEEMWTNRRYEEMRIKKGGSPYPTITFFKSHKNSSINISASRSFLSNK